MRLQTGVLGFVIKPACMAGVNRVTIRFGSNILTQNRNPVGRRLVLALRVDRFTRRHTSTPNLEYLISTLR